MVRLLAALVALAVLVTAPPLLAAAPVGEEADEDVESVSSACPRRAAATPEPLLPARFTAHPQRRAAKLHAAPLLTSGRVGPVPHPRC